MSRTVYLVRRENEDRVRAVFTSWMRADRFALRCAQRDDTHYVVDGYILDPDTDDLIAAARGREEPAEGGVAETPPALPHPQTPPTGEWPKWLKAPDCGSGDEGSSPSHLTSTTPPHAA